MLYSDSEFKMLDVVKLKGSVNEVGVVIGIRRCFKRYPDQFNVIWLRFPNIEEWKNDYELESMGLNVKEIILKMLGGKNGKRSSN